MVHEIVRFARQRRILCQGRGSAAYSAVCFALGITELDPTRINLLFERFISHDGMSHRTSASILSMTDVKRLFSTSSAAMVASALRSLQWCPPITLQAPYVMWPRPWACLPIRSVPSQTAVAAGRITSHRQSDYVNQVSIQQVPRYTVSWC